MPVSSVKILMKEYFTYIQCEIQFRLHILESWTQLDMQKIKSHGLLIKSIANTELLQKYERVYGDILVSVLF